MSEHDLNKMCLGCMRNITDINRPCPFCGSSQVQNQPHQLSAGCFLAGKYLVGRVLGEGGFGITYLGWDVSQNVKVAIKEYYPADSVSRQGDLYTVAPRTMQGAERVFNAGKDKFFSEAQSLAQFDMVPGIVRVFDYFQENNTAYIIMEFIEGQTLRDYLDALGQPLLLSDILALLAPVVDSIGQVHATNLIHRDISPDNIMVTENGITKLLDFGAARFFSLQGEHSNTINVKMGYAPQEQYQTHGNQGAWTDVYALAATIYRAITGTVPPSALDRGNFDSLAKPSALGIAISPGQEAALLKGMAVYPENRYQTVGEFYKALRDGTAATRNTDASQISPGAVLDKGVSLLKRRNMWCWQGIALVVVMVILAFFTCFFTVAGMEFMNPNTNQWSPADYAEFSKRCGIYFLGLALCAGTEAFLSLQCLRTKGEKNMLKVAVIPAALFEVLLMLYGNYANGYGLDNWGDSLHVEIVPMLLGPILPFLLAIGAMHLYHKRWEQTQGANPQ